VRTPGVEHDPDGLYEDVAAVGQQHVAATGASCRAVTDEAGIDDGIAASAGTYGTGRVGGN
jgi:hypothetical protein